MKWLLVLIFLFISCAKTHEKRLFSKINAKLSELTNSKEFSNKLLNMLEKWHPGDQEKIYHSFKHTLLVANLMRKEIKNSKESLTKKQQLLLLIAALFHDLDPKRDLNTPPRVEETLKFLDEEEFDFVFDHINQKELNTLISYTDYHPDPIKLNELLNIADEMAQAYFRKIEWAKRWGRKLSNIDKLAMYVQDWSLAEESAIKLGFEIGRDANYMLEGTHNFLRPLEKEIENLNLSNRLQDNFKNNFKKFEDLANK